MGQFVDEFRGTDHLVYAEVQKDNNTENEGYVTGTVKVLAPVAEISKTVETASDTKYYDNKPVLTINAEGADTITLTVPALDLETLAAITGKVYDATTGAFCDGERHPKYYALGYRLRLTDGTYRYVWRYKGSFGVPDETSQTENAGTDSNNQQLTYTGIMTQHNFTKTGTGEKALVVDERDDKADLSTFFDTVTTCDTLQAKSE
jgi:phi13 family phage major tail protein